ncbi:unnamed protein product [Lymnaea stagnalis]|uniref:Uncharacterized protein n=1 Tax=Lymnaea stagnalis TaxID=6523 RepID=A0AAV2H1U8_LYMST
MEFYYALTTLVGLSLLAQLVFAVLIFVIWVRESDQNQRQEYFLPLSVYLQMSETSACRSAEEKAKTVTLKRDEEFLAQRSTNRLNYLTTVLVFSITVINMFITGFGIKLDPSFKPTVNSS